MRILKSITIPDNLTTIEEYKIVSEELLKAYLKEHKRITDGKSDTLIQSPEQYAFIVEKKHDRAYEVKECPCCGKSFSMKDRRSLWHNYGWAPKQIHFCSIECRHNLIVQAGEGRISFTKKNIKFTPFIR
ncbi:hypothetical protein [Flammeovirga sp. OC4]|uniref:hypothetical protein n=1 Tax=Flammeovirga sp. OC4 TaxID=1382345 RepID=UPI0005C5E877|nr:hypothetical protein [Flammeovirga sp. OC4]